jgi:hypothetical protein
MKQNDKHKKATGVQKKWKMIKDNDRSDSI